MNNMAAIYNAGVKIGCGNDGGMPFIFPGAMGLEMHLLKQIGYAPSDILKMATINNAEILGLDKDLGSIEKGKIADLAVFAGNPLDSFENTFKARCVFQAGKMVFM
jgi:imidazolonepropionase-like amidohydrolase